MKKNSTLSTQEYNSKSQKYDDLLAEGIELIQKFSGDNWTDYNYHDPGITILEQICYAITDLGYKANFPIEDLLMIGVDDFDYKKNNLFYQANEIFQSKPHTINDIRRLILDNIFGVSNVWIDTSRSSDIHLNGLFSIRLQISDNINDDEVNDIISKTRLLIMENRAICTDLKNIKILKKKLIGFSADITIESFYVAEEILAKIFFDIEKRLNEKVKVVGYEFFDERKIDDINIYSGVETKNGIILDENLKDKTNQIYISEILEIIKKTEGVIEIKNFQVYVDGIKVLEDIITFSKDNYPSLEPINNLYSKDFVYDINFFRNDSLYNIDKLLFDQIYENLISEENEMILSTKPKNKFKKGRFNLKSLIKYYSIINEFPSMYGLRERELDSKSSESRIGVMKQLKSFLLIFDQLMSNFLSQLVNTRNVFSINNQTKNYFNQVPDDINNINELLADANPIDFLKQIDKKIENLPTFYKRKNMFLSHMISRFGEYFNTKLIKNIKENEVFSSVNKYDPDQYALEAKVKYANNLLKLGRNRNAGYNYLDKKDNLSGLEKRISLLLSIENEFSMPEIDYENDDVKLVERNIWTKKSIAIKNDNINFLSLPKTSYNNSRVNFYLKNYSSYKELFTNGLLKKSYQIIKNEKKYLLLFNSNSSKIPVKIGELNSLEESQKRIDIIINKLIKINRKSEGFFIVEHLLLRPVENKAFTINVENNFGKSIFRSSISNDFKYLSNKRDSLNDIMKDELNYSIHPTKPDSKFFEISIYDVDDNKLLKSSKKFKSLDQAQEFVKNCIKISTKFKFNIVSKNNFENKFPDNFNYSNEVTILFPEWPSRFQNIEFKNYIDKVIDEYIPAHIKYNLYFIDYSQTRLFKDLFNSWKKLKRRQINPKIDLKSLELIQFILSLKDD